MQNTHISVDENNVISQTRVVIAAVSSKIGTVLIDILNKGNSIKIFLEFLIKLRKKMKFKAFAIYLDNLTIHRAKII